MEVNVINSVPASKLIDNRLVIVIDWNSNENSSKQNNKKINNSPVLINI